MKWVSLPQIIMPSCVLDCHVDKQVHMMIFRREIPVLWQESFPLDYSDVRNVPFCHLSCPLAIKGFFGQSALSFWETAVTVGNVPFPCPSDTRGDFLTNGIFNLGIFLAIPTVHSGTFMSQHNIYKFSCSALSFCVLVNRPVSFSHSFWCSFFLVFK